MKKKHVVVFVFGEAAVDAYEDGGFKEMRKVVEDGNGSIIKREFDTEAEVRAYQQGLEDMNGWQNCTILDDDDVKRHPKIIDRLNDGKY